MPLTEEEILDLIDPKAAAEVLPTKIERLTQMIQETALDYSVISGIEKHDKEEIKALRLRLDNLIIARTAYEDRLKRLEDAAAGKTPASSEPHNDVPPAPLRPRPRPPANLQ